MNRLRWAIRRGMLELDLVFQPFLENVYPTLPEADQALFIKLLDSEDQDLFKWFLKSEKPEDGELQQIVELILSHTGLQSD